MRPVLSLPAASPSHRHSDMPGERPPGVVLSLVGCVPQGIGRCISAWGTSLLPEVRWKWADWVTGQSPATTA